MGQAVGRNSLSIIVPCHRVVGKNGRLTGYAGGLKRKQFLLDLEKDTVDFGDNYAATKQEPLVLPARLPNLMVNGSSGIAVGA